MEFNEKSILFASLLGSKVAQQIPRFETIQNKLGKHVLPLPPRILIPVASWDSRAGYESTGDVKAGELWMADAPKSESQQFFPFTLIEELGREFLLPYEPMLSISSKNNIVKRTVAKADDFKYQGTVKERWSRDDYEIKITELQEKIGKLEEKVDNMKSDEVLLQKLEYWKEKAKTENPFLNKPNILFHLIF